MTEFVAGRQFLNIPLFCPEKTCLLIIWPAYIQVHFSLDLMEANDLSHDQNDPRELS